MNNTGEEVCVSVSHKEDFLNMLDCALHLGSKQCLVKAYTCVAKIAIDARILKRVAGLLDLLWQTVSPLCKFNIL